MKDSSKTKPELLKDIAACRRHIAKLEKDNAALRREKDLAQSLIKASPTFFVAIAGDGTIKEMNDAMLSRLGYTLREVQGKKYMPMVVPREERRELTKVFSTLTREKRATINQNHIVTKKGEKVLVEWHGMPLIHENGSLEYFIGIGIDITERKQQEEALQESEERFQAIINSAIEAIVSSDGNGNLVFWSHGAEAMFGYTAEEILGKPSYLILEQSQRKRDKAGLQKIQSQGTSPAIGKISESFGLRKDGSTFPSETSISSWETAKGTFYSAIIRDVTGRKKIEAELAEREEQIKAIFDSAIDAIFSTDDTGRIIAWNKGAEEMFGYTEKEIIDKPSSILVPEPQQTMDRRKMRKMKADGNLSKGGRIVESKGRRKNGGIFPIETSFNSWKTQKGLYYTAIVRNVTERKRAEDALRESEERFRSVVQTANDAIITVDSKGTIVSWNRGAEHIFGYNEEEALGTSYLMLTPPEFLDRQKQSMRHILKHGLHSVQQQTREGICIRKDGKRITVEFSFTAWEQNNKTYFTNIVRDITEHKETATRLQEAFDYLDNIFKTSPDMIIVTDGMGTITMSNAAVEKTLGYKPDELIGKHTSELVLSESAESIGSNRLMPQLYEKGYLKDFETTWLRKDGTGCPVECNIILTFGPDGASTGGISVIRDITDRKKIEQQLIQAAKLKSLGELTAGVAHDFNNVLAAILGRVQLLSRQITGQNISRNVDTLTRGLEIIENAALDGAETVRRIQEFSRKREDDKNFVITDINQVLEDALAFTQARWENEAESKGIRIRIEQDTCPVHPVYGSPSELREVFTNIITNAIDAMPEGGTLHVKTSAEGGQVVVAVSDTGRGVPAEIQDRIFDPFFTTKGPQSTGLGMSVSYGIISRHNGTIHIKSKEGTGTTFKVTLPPSKASETRKDEKSIPDTDEILRVLVIDDNASVRELLEDILTEIGHNVTSAASGAEGVAQFRQNRFDIVFTDLAMPGMTGWQVAEAVKETSPQTPVILTTGWKVQIGRQKLQKSTIDRILSKPFKVDSILQAIHAVFTDKKS